MKEKLENLLKERIALLAGERKQSRSSQNERLMKKKKSLKQRGGHLVKVMGRGNIEKMTEREAIYTIHWSFAIKHGDQFYIEEEVERRRADFSSGELIGDIELIVPSDGELDRNWMVSDTMRSWPAFRYDRLKAVQYAERWWNEFNPSYPKFNDDCTNFISQCLHAGGVPMWGQPERTRGWWIDGKSNWSYSWTVAHAFMLMLKGAGWTVEVESPSELVMGDIICYDFEGDGRFNHNTIVTGMDGYGNPLVNAHTTNSRMRFWNYEDSTAYTPNIQYKFFHIKAR
ncbi:hypothetical protein CYL18_15485 [Pradoshia eiseniae]|uniref:Putative amidase domain-containing protein n=1 Tax=Pradoshia eiseniae TaxID=2064768 RepID=A0A2S7MWX7_9BACI|nr:amidase domain-containing protein [Pradoshia eiseniae]PQD94269.1 hypothetical protein CYL18_15485 [Pradoshia eiseniae]